MRLRRSSASRIDRTIFQVDRGVLVIGLGEYVISDQKCLGEQTREEKLRGKLIFVSRRVHRFVLGSPKGKPG